MEEAHKNGNCKPCAYFLLKKDGCRWGMECEFCHLCPSGELKKRKKEKAKVLKKEEQQRHQRRNQWYARNARRAGRGRQQAAITENATQSASQQAARQNASQSST
jgi:hypothetical protein